MTLPPQVIDKSDHPSWADEVQAIIADCQLTTPKIRCFENVRVLPGSTLYDTGNPRRSAAGVYRRDGSFVEESGRFKGVGDERIVWTSGGFDATHFEAERFAPRDQRETGLYLGSIPAHFGHLIVEGFARFWAINEHPDVPLYFTDHQSNGGGIDQLRASLKRLGGLQFDFSRLNLIDETTEFETLHVPEPGVILRRSASEAYVQAMRRLSLVADREPDTDQPVYLSRAGLGAGGTLRQILGESLLDTALEQAGVKILRLQDMSFEDGLRALARHKTIIGPLGSALHNSVFLGPRRLVYLANAINPDKLRTFLALDRAAGHETIIMRFSDLIQDGRSAAWATGFNKGSEGNALIDFNAVLATLCDLGVIDHAPQVNMDDPVLSEAKRAYLTALRERSLPAQPPQLHETLLAEISSLT